MARDERGGLRAPAPKISGPASVTDITAVASWSNRTIPTPVSEWSVSTKIPADSRSTCTRARPSPASQSIDADLSRTMTTAAVGRSIVLACRSTVHVSSVATLCTSIVPLAVSPAAAPV